jgi:CRP/FNR family transcriptional regulator, cyclic AMP receptor protein
MAADKDMLERLKTVPLFEGLSASELKDVLNNSRVVEHDGGHDIIEAGTGSVGFHLILEGQVSVSQGSRAIGTLGPGDYFGEISVIDGLPRTSTVTTTTPVRTLSLAAWKFQPLLEAHPTLTRKILLGLCKTLRAAEASRNAT